MIKKSLVGLLLVVLLVGGFTTPLLVEADEIERVQWFKSPVIGTGYNDEEVNDSYRPEIAEALKEAGIGWSAVYYPHSPPYQFCVVRVDAEERVFTKAEKLDDRGMEALALEVPCMKYRWLDQPFYPADVANPQINPLDPVETRYFRSDSHTINGLLAEKLLTEQSSSDEYFEKASGTYNAYQRTFMAVYKRTEGGSQTTLGSYVAMHQRSTNGQGMVSANWSCPETALVVTDAIRVTLTVRLYKLSDVYGSTSENFITEQLGAESLDAASWTLYRYSYYAGDGGSAVGRIYYGDGAHDTRITNFTWTEPPLPTVTTQAATNIEDTTATGNGNITETFENCDRRGIVWDLATHGDPGNVAPGASGYANDVGTDGSFPVGAFTENLTGLPTGDTIYARAYAHNSSGYAYGGEVNFLTKPAAPTNVAATDGDPTDKVVITWVKSTGATGYRVYEGANDISGLLGDVATYDDTGAAAGVVTPGTATASDATSASYVTLSLAGESVADGASRTYKVVAVNATGNSDDSTTDAGYRGTGAITYAWQRSTTDSDADFGAVSGGTTDPYNDTGAPADGSGRWYYCEVSATGTTTQDSTHDRGYRAAPPTLTTLASTGFDELWAIVNAYIDDEGLATVSEIGFDYGLDIGYGSSDTEVGTWNTDDTYSLKLTGLSPATVYYYRAKAKNNGIWGYGDNMYFSTKGSAVIYEYLNTGGDADGDDIYGNNWAAQQFTCSAVSHSITHVRVYLKRVLLPGDVYLELYHADAAHKPTGSVITSKMLDGDAMATTSTWYEFDLTETTLESGLEYAIVVKALDGDATNYIEWKWDSGGGLADAIASLSVDGGISWTVDAGGADYLFEIWGNPTISVESAAVFSGYRLTGDWLIALTYKNEYAPYYPDENSASYFYIQLLDGAVLKAQTSCLAWGYRPGAIYLSKSLADTLEWGATDYTVRLYGNFGTNPYSDYLLAAADWEGTDLDLLDDWVIAQAKDIGNDIGATLVTTIADQGEVLNSYGHAMFSIGIPQLNVVRPELFELVGRQPEYTEEDFTGDLQGETDWEARVGPQVAKVLTDGGDLIGVDGDFMGGIITFLVFITVVGILSLTGHIGVGLAFGYTILLTGAWFGLISWVIIGVITFLAAVIFVYKVWLTR